MEELALEGHGSVVTFFLQCTLPPEIGTSDVSQFFWQMLSTMLVAFNCRRRSGAAGPSLIIIKDLVECILQGRQPLAFNHK
jgi:hypothetical protein